MSHNLYQILTGDTASKMLRLLTLDSEVITYTSICYCFLTATHVKTHGIKAGLKLSSSLSSLAPVLNESISNIYLTTCSPWAFGLCQLSSLNECKAGDIVTVRRGLLKL